MSSSPSSTAYVALGGNQGDVLQQFRAALAGLAATGLSIHAVSPAYRTEALVLPDEPPDAAPAADYWNAACALHTQLPPEALLDELQRLEHAAGRVRTRRWGPRPLDLDLLVYNAHVLNTARLTLPHPELAKRIFVLRPLIDIAPELCIAPHGVAVKDLLARHTNPAQGVLEIRTGWLEDLDP